MGLLLLLSAFLRVVSSEWQHHESAVLAPVRIHNASSTAEKKEHAHIVENLDGGLLEVMQRVYMLVNRTRGTTDSTVYLPNVYSAPCYFSNMDPHPIKFGELFDEKAFCEYLEGEGITHKCLDAPQEFAAKPFRAAVPAGNCEDMKMLTVQTNYMGLKVTTGQEPYINKKFLHIDHKDTEIPTPEWKDFLKFSNILKPSLDIEERVQQLLQKLGGSGKYVAIHMRTEDDWKEHANGKCWSSPEAIVKMVTTHSEFQRLQAEANGQGRSLKVFVATGDKAPALAAWKSVDGVEAYTSDEVSSGLFWNPRAMLDWELIKRARMYIGSKTGSTFSLVGAQIRDYKESFAYGKEKLEHHVPDPKVRDIYGKWEDVKYLSCYGTFDVHTR